MAVRKATELLKSKFFLIPYLAIFFVFINRFPMQKSAWAALLILTVFVGIMLPKCISNEKMTGYFTAKREAALVLISLYAAFACFGYPLFLSGDLIHWSFWGFVLLILAAAWFLPIVFLLLFGLETLRQDVARTGRLIPHKKKSDAQAGRQAYNKKRTAARAARQARSNKETTAPAGERLQAGNDAKVFFCAFGIVFGILELVLVAFYPGNLTPDSISQWRQALGLEPLTDYHPALHTLLIRLLLIICNSPMFVLTVQILCYALLAAAIFHQFYCSGLNPRAVWILAALFALNPANYMMAATLLKDVAYALALAWLTWILYNAIQKPEAFFRSPGKLLKFTAAMLLVFFTRHNGVLPFLVTVLFLIWLTVKYWEKVKMWATLALGLSVLGVFLIQGPVYRGLNVKPNTLSPYATMFNALGSCVNKDCAFSPETTKTLESVMPLADWKKYYARFDGDPYIFTRKGGMDLSEITAKQAFSAYLEALEKYPTIVIKDRLDGMDLLWDVSQPKESYNERFADGVWYDESVMDPAVLGISFNKDGYYQNQSGLAQLFRLINKASSHFQAMDIFIWRSGIYLLFLLTLFLFWAKNKMNRLFFILAPFLGNTLSWILMLNHQDFRYVYYVQPIFFLLLIITLTYRPKDLPDRR